MGIYKGRSSMKSLNVLLGAAACFVLLFAATASADTQPVQEPEETQHQQSVRPQEQEEGANPSTTNRTTSPQAFQLNWLSINGGGAINASSASYQLGLSVGQSVAGFAASSSYQMGIGFWYGTAGAPACAAAKGDMNATGDFTPADVVLMLNCAFLGSGTCDLCFTDVNCSADLTPADVVLELNKVFLGSPLPC